MKFEKVKIFYSRQYRRLKLNKLATSLYLLFFVLPVLLLILFNLDNLTMYMSKLAAKVLFDYYPSLNINIVADKVGILGQVFYVDLPGHYPSFNFVVLNIVAILIMLVVFNNFKSRGSIITIFFNIALGTHLINCLYFIFAQEFFPYTALEYSELYIKQQIGVWVVFTLLTGLSTSFFTGVNVLYKMLALIVTMLYSIVFGVVRYVLFLFILQKYSLLYMANMFFTFGPFFDFLYLVGIYALFINKVTNIYSSDKGREEWLWS